MLFTTFLLKPNLFKNQKNKQSDKACSKAEFLNIINVCIYRMCFDLRLLDGVDEVTASWLSSTIGLASIIGRPCTGFLANYFHVHPLTAYVVNQVYNKLYTVYYYCSLFYQKNSFSYARYIRYVRFLKQMRKQFVLVLVFETPWFKRLVMLKISKETLRFSWKGSNRNATLVQCCYVNQCFNFNRKVTLGIFMTSLIFSTKKLRKLKTKQSLFMFFFTKFWDLVQFHCLSPLRKSLSRQCCK